MAHVGLIEVVDGERGTPDVRGLPRKGAGCGRGWRLRMTRTGKKSRTGILADPPRTLARAAANSAYLGSRAATRAILRCIIDSSGRRCDAATPPGGPQTTSRSTVNTTMPTTIVPSMLRRQRNQPRPASAA
ncbi:hypothetical protein A8H40_27795 [Burkholderia multivorans]|nr:hypothetical protein A8H40_27795 [Burkholderia multivorans]PRG00448.1 hypothetical protein C6Q21_25775 [Burkholderia multivorans]PRH04524.1 hypothetical protein C6T61_19385 [Burkholderia multivorans]PRH19898.1 hypothetical protein C6T56_14625 [Burkholderia multivorans]